MSDSTKRGGLMQDKGRNCVRKGGLPTRNLRQALMAEMENVSYVPLKQPIVFTVEGFIITRQQGYPLFLVSLIVYAVMLLGNITVVTVIATDVKLHKPMYVMMCNLAACDLLGGTTVMAQLMPHFLTGYNTIGYTAAIFQVFVVHTYSLAVATILSAMAYDRYVAICQPLHYHTIMTTRKLVSLCFLVWFIVFCLVAILLILNGATPLCGTLITHVYCSNGAILRLACIPTPIINIYEMCSIWFLRSGCFLIIAFSYAKILQTCVIKREKNSRSKAIQTCASHLTIYILFEVSGFIIVLAYRLQEISPNARKFCAIITFIVPPTINPIIYGIATTDIRTSIVKLFKSTVSPKIGNLASITQLST
ncbi:olfactory receptor 52K2-like [Anguilla anguilla]|uniref:olfactory receptor 52K2-like n=1 Tax=Anguilla anguilla TaxID=7936 RepID=UPI0015AE0D5F|nr:olfactory receptor 52K2-like [Anguilla anguilla]